MTLYCFPWYLITTYFELVILNYYILEPRPKKGNIFPPLFRYISCSFSKNHIFLAHNHHSNILLFKASLISQVRFLWTPIFCCSFQSTYPSWEPNAEGKQFVLNLRTFREQNLHGQVTQPVYSPPRMWQGSPNLRGHGDRISMFSRDIVPQYGPGTGYHLGSLWLIDADQKNHPYLLDWYYTSRPHHPTTHTTDIPEELTEATEQQFGDYTIPSNLTRNDVRYKDYWEEPYDHRSRPSLGASTSTPYFGEGILQNQEFGNVARPPAEGSHWWARSGSKGAQPQASFLEPPDFNRQAPGNYYDNFSDRGSEEQEQHLDWRNSSKLSHTIYMDDLDTGDFNLHFDDIYSKPPETPRIDPEAPSFVWSFYKLFASPLVFSRGCCC